MPRLNCNANKCQYNYDHKCTRNAINVGDCYKSGNRQAECKSYKEGLQTVGVEFAKELDHMNLNNVSIYCEAHDCLYNMNKSCKVSEVDIKKPTESCDCVNAECTTYRK